MDDQKVKAVNQTADQEPPQRPWVTPSFERVHLKEALSGLIKTQLADGQEGSS
jgi:hypothetical protein